MLLVSKWMREFRQWLLAASAPADSDEFPVHVADTSVLTEAGTSALMIACPNPTAEDRARDGHRLRGQFLARQERWADLSNEIKIADQTRKMTPAGMPVSELLCFGARSDVLAAVEHTFVDERAPDVSPSYEGIEALESMFAETPRDPMRAAVVAQAHMDIGWIWRGSSWLDQVPRRNLDAFKAHFDRARDILAAVSEDGQTSPLLCSAGCALNASGIVPGADIARDYERLINLNPKTPAPMRALGNYLTPKWYGSYETLEVEARRTAARTHADWSAGGYAWVMFDALSVDMEVCGILDVDFFVEGLQDILERMPDQHTVNTLAAFCALTIGTRRTGQTATDAKRMRLAECAHWIVRRHLTELHPLIWAHAAAGFDNSLTVPSPRRFAAVGQQSALRTIAALFQNDIAAGRRIIFTAEGPVAEHC